MKLQSCRTAIRVGILFLIPFLAAAAPSSNQSNPVAAAELAARTEPPAAVQNFVPGPAAGPFEIADALSYISTLVTIFGVLLTVISIVFIIVSFAGFREILQIRDLEGRLRPLMAHSTEARLKYEEAKQLVETLVTEVRAQLDSLKLELSKESSRLIEAAYHFSVGEDAYRRGDFDIAIKEYTLASRLRPLDKNIAIRLGRSLVNVGQIEDARSQFEDVLANEPDDALALYGLATVARYSDLTLALDYAHRAWLSNPQSAEISDYLGLLRRDAQDYPGAAAAHEVALAIRPAAVTHFYLALLYGRLGRDTEAKAQALCALVCLAKENDAVRPVWNHVIRWAAATIQLEDNDAREQWKQVELNATTERVRRAVMDHARFLRETLGLDQAKFGEELHEDNRVLGDAKKRKNDRA